MKRRHRGSQPINDDFGIRELIVGYREILKHAAAFTCICCQQDKAPGDAEGVHVYKTDDPVLQRAMQTPKGPRVDTYVICIACVDSLPDDVIHEKVTAELAKAGFFGAEVTAQVSHAERENTFLIAAFARLQEENERLREEISELKLSRNNRPEVPKGVDRRLNMAQPQHTKGASRMNPEVSISVKYEVPGGHDPAALERLLEFFRELARSKGSFQEQTSKA